MTRVLVPPEIPCVVADFDPREDMLVVALPGDAAGGLDHTLGFRHDRARNFLEVALTHRASKARFLVRLPGLSHLDPSVIAVISLSEADTLLPSTPAPLTGDGLYPVSPSRPGTAPRKFAFVHRHDWYRDGPPPERFFDLSDPASEIDLRLDPDSSGPIYAIRLTETAASPRRGPPGRFAPPRPAAAETFRSIVLAQTAPGTPPLSTGLLAQWFANRLGTPEFRAIAWIWLGSEGHYTDPDTGKRHRFGAINTSPNLAIHGPIAGSIAIDR